MMKIARSTLMTTATALALLTGTLAWAQTSGHPEGHHTGVMRTHMAERMAERQLKLKEALKLTPAQEAPWTQYTQAMRPPEPGLAGGARPDRDAWARMTTPERLDHLAARQAERDARMTQIAHATRALYAALSPEQQKIFDSQAPMARMGKGMGMEGQHHHRGGPGMVPGRSHGG